MNAFSVLRRFVVGSDLAKQICEVSEHLSEDLGILELISAIELSLFMTRAFRILNFIGKEYLIGDETLSGIHICVCSRCELHLKYNL